MKDFELPRGRVLTVICLTCVIGYSVWKQKGQLSFKSEQMLSDEQALQELKKLNQFYDYYQKHGELPKEVPDNEHEINYVMKFINRKNNVINNVDERKQ